MNIRKRTLSLFIFFLLGLFLLIPSIPVLSEVTLIDRNSSSIKVAFFYSEDCKDCQVVKKKIFPQLEEKFKDFLQIEYYDINNPQNYEKLIKYEKKCQDTDNEIPVIFIAGKVLSGKEEIKNNLNRIVEQALRGKASKDSTPLAFMAYFSKRGCLECGRLSYDLKNIKDKFPNLIIREFDLGLKENKELNEALCEYYKVPRKKRLIAPAIFIGNNYLVGKEVKGTKLRELVKKYSASGTQIPWKITIERRQKARKNILKRFYSFGLPAVLSAGLIDGINPCAFVTIIFFISYLSFGGRKGKEILFVGTAFTFSVFLTYLLVGLGALKFIQSLSFLPLLSKIICLITALIAIALGLISLNDYFKWRKNKVKEITLKLPHFLRKRINKVISKNSRLNCYILAALATGFLVSILELACTGQVYLPTIIFVNQASNLRFSAFTYLLLYNLAFISPLVSIFLFVYFGLTSAQLTKIMQKNIGLVKISTSALFFSLAGLLIAMI
jgi:disulfide oxidoreductase YuzD